MTAVTLLGNVAGNMPLLKFGMMGFDNNARQQIIDAVQALPPSTVIWRDSVFSAADCWLVCGEKTHPVPSSTGPQNTTLRVIAKDVRPANYKNASICFCQSPCVKLSLTDRLTPAFTERAVDATCRLTNIGQAIRAYDRTTQPLFGLPLLCSQPD